MTSRDELRRRLSRLSTELALPGEFVGESEHLTAPEPAEAVDLTIGIATFDDFDGAFFTIAALRLYHPDVMDRAEILLIDNHPDGPEAPSLRRLRQSVPRLRYVPVRSVMSTAVRDLIFRLARGEVVVVLDSHVLVQPGGLASVAAHLADPACRDLVHGPLVTSDAQTLTGTHWDPVWRAGMFGTWAIDQRGVDPAGPAFPIPMQGLGLFACRRDAWPGLNPHFSGFGGEEGYLHEKVRMHGGRVVCLPGLRWVHRFERPRGVRYDLVWEHRVRNYVVGWTELGLDVDQVRAHFTDFLGAGIGSYIDDLRGRMTHPLWAYDGIVVVNDDLRPGRWRRTRDVLAELSLQPRRMSAVMDDTDAPSGALSLAAAVRYATLWGWSSFLVIGDDVVRTEADLHTLAGRCSEDAEPDRGIGRLVFAHHDTDRSPGPSPGRELATAGTA